MDNDQNWYRQLAALILLSASRAAVEYITNPGSRADAQRQLREQFASIDYDAVARALTRALDDVAATSKNTLADTIDVLHDRSVDAVEEAKSRAEKQLGQKKSGGRLRWLFFLAIGGAVAYFLMDEQRRDDLLDRLTGASGPIQQSTYSTMQDASATTQRAADSATGAVNAATDSVNSATQSASDAAKSATRKAEDKASESTQS
jgi:hypothetical protein